MMEHTTTEFIREELAALQDSGYKDFMCNLIPTVPRERVVGVRTPALRSIAKRLVRTHAEGFDIRDFLDDLPHALFEEDQLHAFIISEMKDFDECVRETDRFLPFVDNWATCDQMSPKVFRRNKDELLCCICRWIESDKAYTTRFGIEMLMKHFLDEDFEPEYIALVSQIRSDEYYVNLMIAWFFAEALAKQYDSALPYIEERALDPWTHNKTIQKSLESRKIAPSRKAVLKSLRVQIDRKNDRKS